MTTSVKHKTRLTKRGELIAGTAILLAGAAGWWALAGMTAANAGLVGPPSCIETHTCPTGWPTVQPTWPRHTVGATWTPTPTVTSPSPSQPVSPTSTPTSPTTTSGSPSTAVPPAAQTPTISKSTTASTATTPTTTTSPSSTAASKLPAVGHQASTAAGALNRPSPPSSTTHTLANTGSDTTAEIAVGLAALSAGALVLGLAGVGRKRGH